ncbi:MAG: hypothetical protein IJ760_07890 [Bacteroidales bacterium]|nr:hypothetical protein [Bacteroidales bacterium]
MSKRYIVALLALTLAMVIASFVVMWVSPAHYIAAMPLLALYFGVVCGVQHWVVTRAMSRSPRAFVQVFLGSVVAVLFIHLAVLAVFLFTRTAQARPFLVAFCIGYFASLVFETVALVQYVKAERNRRLGNNS